jgi:hypothetical protein|tara:strand:- start:2347 stop:2646 length:300 start_codon:yes stop_codon:yes gene_type:complete
MAKKAKEVELVQDVQPIEENSKVTQEELQGIQDAERKIQDVTYQLGDLQLVKLNVEKNEEALKQKFQSIIDERNVLVSGLKEKYGDVSIDKNTGEIQSK